jgi:hypothetical protein
MFLRAKEVALTPGIGAGSISNVDDTNHEEER